MKKYLGLCLIVLLLTGCGKSKTITCSHEQEYSSGTIVKVSEEMKMTVTKGKLTSGKLVSSATVADDVSEEDIVKLKEQSEESCKSGSAQYKSCVVTRNGKTLTVTAVADDKYVEEEDKEMQEAYKKAVEEEGYKDSIEMFIMKQMSASASEVTCSMK